jgi:hypothetical protein
MSEKVTTRRGCDMIPRYSPFVRVGTGPGLQPGRLRPVRRRRRGRHVSSRDSVVAAGGTLFPPQTLADYADLPCDHSRLQSQYHSLASSWR